jgi:hypothetical protein
MDLLSRCHASPENENHRRRIEKTTGLHHVKAELSSELRRASRPIPAGLRDRRRQGMVVLLRGDGEPRYAPIEDAKESPANAKVEPDLLTAVIYATGKYDPRWEAVLLLEEGDGFTVYIVRHNGAAVIGGVGWTAIN